jgi:hypothetical protein
MKTYSSTAHRGAVRPLAKLVAFVTFAGPLDLLTRFARRSSPRSIRRMGGNQITTHFVGRDGL